MPRVLADHPNNALTLYHLTLLTSRLHRSLNLHLSLLMSHLKKTLLKTIGDPAPGQVIGGELHYYLIATKDLDVM